MKPIWRKWTGTFLLIVLIAGMNSGCSMQNTAGNTNSASGSAAQSGQTAEKNATDSIRITPPATTYSRYYSSTCLYVTDFKTSIHQYSLDGIKKQSYKTGDYTGAIWATDQFLYYTTASKYSDTGEGALWRIPLSKVKGEEHLEIGKKEKLIPVSDWYDFLDVTDKYVAYMTNDSIFRLDLTTKKTKNITKNVTFSESTTHPYLVTDAFLNPLVNNHTTFCYDEDATMYRLDLQKGSCKKLGNVYAQNGIASRICQNGDLLYFGTADEENGAITEYNIKTNTRKTILSGKKIKQLLQKEKPWNYDKNDIRWIAYPSFVYNNRLYLSIALRWFDEEYEDEVCHYADLVISCQITDGSGLQYEKALSQCMRMNTENEIMDDPIQPFIDETGHVIDCMGDYAIVTTTAYEESDSFAWIFYNLKTGKQHKVSRGDKEQFYLYFIGETGYHEEED